jgi:hypothetical protein
VSSRPPLGRLITESAVIILSILAAFALDAWWDERKERVEEREVLEALHAEFTAARERIERYQGLQERVMNSTESVLGAVRDGMNRGSETVTLADSTLGLTFIPPTLSVSLGTLNGLTSGGRLDIIEDRALRTALGSWGAELAELAEEEEFLRDYVLNDMDEAFRGRLDMGPILDITDRLTNGEGVSEGGVVPLTRLPIDSDLLGIYNTRHNWLRHALAEYPPVIAEVDRILELIQASW